MTGNEFLFSPNSFAIGLPSAKTRDRQLVRGYVLGAAIQIGARIQNSGFHIRAITTITPTQRANDIGPSIICMRLSFRPWISLPVWT